MKRYAEGTTVSVASSRGEITGILAKHGVVRMGWQTGPLGDELMFEVDGRTYRLPIRKPTEDSEVAWARSQGQDVRYIDIASRVEKEWRRRWRATVLLLKAKLEFADGETSTVARELMPYLLTAGGETLGDLVEAGRVPMLKASRDEAVR